MMKAVLMSIQPEWCQLIASGKKTIEVRKTRPKNETPFKVYIYETKESKRRFLDHRFNSDIHGFSHHSEMGKVIGEFVCDAITPLYNVATTPWKLLSGNVHEQAKKLIRNACLTEEEIHKYANGKNCYALHISDLKIYETPKELTEFFSVDNEAVKRCKNRERIYNNPDFTNGALLPGSYLCNDKVDWCVKCKRKPIRRPPQSWCYVEELQG